MCRKSVLQSCFCSYTDPPPAHRLERESRPSCRRNRRIRGSCSVPLSTCCRRCPSSLACRDNRHHWPRTGSRACRSSGTRRGGSRGSQSGRNCTGRSWAPGTRACTRTVHFPLGSCLSRKSSHTGMLETPRKFKFRAAVLFPVGLICADSRWQTFVSFKKTPYGL